MAMKHPKMALWRAALLACIGAAVLPASSYAAGGRRRSAPEGRRFRAVELAHPRARRKPDLFLALVDNRREQRQPAGFRLDLRSDHGPRPGSDSHRCRRCHVHVGNLRLRLRRRCRDRQGTMDLRSAGRSACRQEPLLRPHQSRRRRVEGQSLRRLGRRTLARA